MNRRNTALLSNEQLIHLYLNRRLDKAIRKAAYEAIYERDNDFEQAPAYLKQKAFSDEAANDPLPAQHKAGLLLLPLIFPLYLAVKAIVASNAGAYKTRLVLFLFLPGGLIGHYGVNRYLAEGNTGKWRAYWTWLCLGYTLWTLLLVLCGYVYFRILQ